MPNVPSAKKRLRQTLRRNMRNKAIRTRIKTVSKRVLKALEEKDDKVSEYLSIAYKTIDMAASKGVIHKNQAARKKASLTKKFQQSKSTSD
jgi:small subunit ribosomal protein S20